MSPFRLEHGEVLLASNLSSSSLVAKGHHNPTCLVVALYVILCNTEFPERGTHGFRARVLSDSGRQ